MKHDDINEIVWDGTNIGENYPGITLPLTYSFIKDAYSNVYENFLLRIGVKQDTIDTNRVALSNMLGYVHGHVFYNIDYWYEFLQFMPGYRFNKKFFEAMLDPAAIKGRDKKIYKLGNWESLRIAFRFFLSLVFFRPLNAYFERTFRKLSRDFKKVSLSSLNNFELVSLFESTEKKFFSLWSITIINDFKVMIFFGLFKKIADKHKNESKEVLRDLYSLKNQPRSILPLKEIVNLAKIIRGNKDYFNLFKKDSGVIVAVLPKDSKYKTLHSLIQSYLEEYGERSSNELKLEEPKFKEDPKSFIELIRYYVSLDKNEVGNLLSHFEAKKFFSIPRVYSFLDRSLLTGLKSITTTGIYFREYYRMKRGKTFQMAREMLQEIGKRMKKAGDISEKDDIFYLYKNEVFDYIRFHSLSCDFKKVIQSRKLLISTYKKEQISRRINTYGFPNNKKHQSPATARNHVLQGQATSRGKTTGLVIVMRKLDLTTNYKGKILVTPATDPGWTVIFPLLKGIITEQGGVLSHASIIARELGIPCITKVNDATSILKSNQIIEMDATSGKVKILH